MNENEAVYCLKADSESHSEVCEECDLYGLVGCNHCQNDAIEIAIKALEEVQQYREIGKVSTCKNAVEICKAMIERGIEPENVEAYIAFEDTCVKKGFTIKGLLEAGEKQTAKNPIRSDKCTCPSCGTYNETWKKRRNTLPSDIVYCWHCGQAVEIFREDEE